MTAFVILVSGMYSEGALNGAALSAAAFNKALPGVGANVVSFGLVLFAFTTIIGWSYYGDRSIYYLFKGKGDVATKIYKWLYVIMIPVGACVPLKFVWTISDITNALMAIPNLVGLLGLSGYVYEMIKDYEKRLSYMKVSLRTERYAR